MKKFTSLFFGLFLALQINVFAERGNIVSFIPGPILTPDLIMSELQSQMDETAFALTNLFTYKKYPVQAVKIFYETIDGKGKTTVASGVVFLPAVPEVAGMPVFSYLHGTLTSDAETPSGLEGLESVIGWIMAMDGYISVLPDYLGLGEEPPGMDPGLYSGIHPYQHAETEASASVDMLKAAMLFCNTNQLVNAKPNGDLYLAGYSQGAHAALATQNELQANPLPELTLRKTVAGSGAYSLSYIQKKYLFEHPAYPSPSFLPYLLLGYQQVYGNLYGNLSQVFVSPYNSDIPGWFDGSLTVDEINLKLPAYWKTMFVPKYLWNIQYDYFHPVNYALRKNDVINWKPKSDLHLYYCTCDELVANENSLLAYLSFILKGSSKVSVLPVGPFKHAECAPFVLLLAKIQFDCASGANPCGIDLLSLLKSASDEDLPEFTNAVLNIDQFPYQEEIMQNKELLAYFNEVVELENLQIYPNPAKDVVFIELPAALPGTSRVSLYDLQGRLVLDKICNDKTIQLDVKPLHAGIYNIVLNGETTSVEKLIVFK
ncbi:T9SS type A sorting domain-containing protein [Mariniphaga sp.]|uniref:T9SS type A sorting domain-containing protein n=1 Tax=Mariniphaga sp. TaxID=1954475 RepID=UPI00356548C4